VDPSTRAKLGAIAGAEVVVLGGFQKVGQTLRAHARFVTVETGEVLGSIRVERQLGQDEARAVFELQDALAAEVRAQVAQVRGQLRPH
jgi:TolB-like protein